MRGLSLASGGRRLAKKRRRSNLRAYRTCYTRKERETVLRAGGTRLARTESADEKIEPSSPKGARYARKKDTFEVRYPFFLHKKSARRGSNPRPPPWQGGAPPLSHSRICLPFHNDKTYINIMFCLCQQIFQKNPI